MTTTVILQAISGMPRVEAIKLLADTIGIISSEATASDIGGTVSTPHGVPVKKRKDDPYQPVWEYLKTITEYSTGKALHAEIIEKFGRDKAPSLSNLYNHLRAGGKP